MKLLRIWGVGVFLSLLLVNASCVWAGATEHQGPSFDCAKATTKVEKMICADAELSRLDAELGTAYGEAKKTAVDPSALEKEQRSWLKERNGCVDAECVADQYRRRLSALSQPPEYKTIYPVDISEFDMDCENPESDRETFICKEAGSEFEEMHNALQWALMRGEEKSPIIESQRRWQKEVLDACQDGYCLRRLAFGKRTKELKELVARPNECYVLEPVLDVTGRVKPIEPIAQVLEANLNQFCDQPPQACELKVAPQFSKHLTFPEWTPLDPETNRGLIEDFFKTPWLVVAKHPGKDEEIIWQKEKLKIDAAFAGKSITFSKGEIDFYNMGKPQTAYRLDYGTCQTDNPQLKNKKDWDQPLEIAPVRIQFAPDIIRTFFKKYFPLGGYFGREVFLYRGETYSYWMFGHYVRGSLETENYLQIVRREAWRKPKGKKQRLHSVDVASFRYQPLEGQK